MRPFFSVSKFSALLLAVGIAAGLYPQTLLAQSSSDQNGLSALVSRQQQRMDLLEEGIKDVRGTIETELQNIRTELETLVASSVASQSGASSDFKSVQGELAKLADNIAIVSQRINNTLDLYSDIEFRILRLEKRMTTLLSLSGDDIVEKLAQGEVSAGGTGPSVSMSRDAQTGETVWTIDKEQLDNQLAEDNASLTAADNSSEDAATSTGTNTATTDTPPQTATGGESVLTPDRMDRLNRQKPLKLRSKLSRCCQFYLMPAQKISSDLRLRVHCKMIWKPQNRPLLNFLIYIQTMRVPLMRYSGWAGYNLFRASLKNQQRLFRNLMPCIPPTHGCRIQPYGLLNLCLNSQPLHRPATFMIISANSLISRQKILWHG